MLDAEPLRLGGPRLLFVDHSGIKMADETRDVFVCLYSGEMTSNTATTAHTELGFEVS